jgi:hypothetical protein
MDYKSAAMIVDWPNIARTTGLPKSELLEKFNTSFGEYKIVIKEIYVIGNTDPNNTLSHYGFNVRRSPEGEDVDSMILERLSHIIVDPHIDTIILASGDGGYRHAMARARACGRNVRVLANKCNMSRRLLRIVGKENVTYI